MLEQVGSGDLIWLTVTLLSSELSVGDEMAGFFVP
jgi:hypothetical protein